MDTDTPAVPTTDPAVFDRVRAALDASGPLAAIDRLCDELKQAEDFQNLFYARLMRKRVELGVPPFPTGPSSELPGNTHEAYEEAIRTAGREVGHIYLSRGDIPKAWAFFRMLGEPEPVMEALRTFTPGPDDDPYPVVEVAWQHGVLPEKGFDLVLDRNGVCSAITMVHSSDLTQNPPLRDYCVKRLVRALYDQLLERLKNDLQSHGIEPSAGTTVGGIVAAHPVLFVEDVYHIDTSHLSSVVQMALQLSPGPELDLARELAEYGSKLSPSLRGDNDPPFEDTYADYKVYLNIVAGVDVEGGLAHFKRKAERGAEDGYSFPAEVLVNLYLKADRLSDALTTAKRFLGSSNERELSCPGVTELARRAGDYAALAAAAKGKADPVTYLAGLIAART